MALTLKTAGSLVSSAAAKDKGPAVKIKILRDTVAGKQPVFTGDELTVSDMEAHLLINLGKAVDVSLLPEEAAPEEAAPEEAAPEAAEVEKEASKDTDSTSMDKAAAKKTKK